MATRRQVYGALTVVFVGLVVAGSLISPELGGLIATGLAMLGVDLHPIVTHIPDFALLREFEGLQGQIGEYLFAIIAGGAIGWGLDRSWTHLKNWTQ